MYSNYYSIQEANNDLSPAYYLIKNEINIAALINDKDKDFLRAYVMKNYNDYKIDENEMKALIDYINVLY